MSTINEARRAFAEFQHEWFEKKGGTRAEGVAKAFRADDVIEALPEAVFSAHYAEVEEWIEALEHCPEVEKRWHGILEYRVHHRVKAELIEQSDVQKGERHG